MREYGTVKLANGEWRLEVEPQVHTRFKRVFEKVAKSRADGLIVISDTPENCRELEWFMQRYPLTVPARDYLETRAREYDQQLQLVADIVSGRIPPRDVPLARPPYQAQLVAAELALQRKRLLVMDQLGAGKTITALCMLANAETRPAVVVTMTDLPDQWIERMGEFTPALTYHKIKRGAAYGKQTRAPYHYGPLDIAYAIERGRPMPDVILMSYSKLVGWVEWLVSQQIRGVVFDEIQDLRTGSTSNKYNAAIRLVRSATYAMGLSATPIYNYGAEVFNVVTVTEPQAFGSHDEFTREWTAPTENGKIGIKEPETLGRYLREQGYAIRRTVKEVTGREISEPIPYIHKIDADMQVLDDFKEMAVKLARVIVSQNGKHSNLQKFQAAGEFDYKLRHATGVAKAPYAAAFAHLLLQSEDKVLMFAWHHDVHAILKEKLAAYGPVFFTGKETPLARQRAKLEFIHGDARVMVISLRAGAGMDGLQAVCHVALFAELDWSPRIHDQCVGRLARPGQEHAVLPYYLISEHGSDPVMVDALGVKNMLSHGILEPDRPLSEKMETSGSNIQALARHLLADAGILGPAPTDGDESPLPTQEVLV